MVTKQKLLYQQFFETLKDTPNPSKGFRFVAFLALEILGGSFSTPPPWCLVGVLKPLVPGGLSQITRIYDPVGFTAAFLIKAKIGLQQLRQKGLDWDQELPEEIYQDWVQLFE